VARSNPHRIVLSEEQERELARRAGAYSGQWREVVCAKAILLAAEGLSNAAIAERRADRDPGRMEFARLDLDRLLDRLD
jgi:hypothetical protein